MEDAVNVFLELREADLAAEKAEEKEAAEAEMLGESNAAENGMSAANMEDSPAAGEGAAAGEGSPGGSQAASGSALGEGDRNVRATYPPEDVAQAQAKKEFALQHALPLKGIRESKGRSSLSCSLIS